MHLYKTKHAWILGGFEYLHADNVIADAGSGGATFRTDDVGAGVHVPYTKLMDGTDNSTAVIPGDATNGLFVQIKAAAAVPVTDNSGSLTVDNGGTFAVQAAQSGTWTVQPGNTANTTAWKVDASSVAVPITDNSGSLTVDNGGTFAVQAAQSGTWTVQPGNTANTTAWKVDASSVAVPITDNSGSLTVDNGGTFAVQNTMAGSTIPAATTMQNAVATNANGSSLNVNGFAAAVLNIVSSPAMSGGTTINFEASVDDTTWVAINGHAVGSSTIATTTTADGDFRLAVAGYKSVRARISAYSAGTVTVKGYSSPVAPAQTIVSLAAGAATIGALTANQSINNAQINGATPLMGNGTTGTGSQRVTIASDNTAFSVNAAQSGTWTVQPGNTANTTAWKVDGSAVTQPVSLASGATSIGKNEDVASADADTGVPAMMIRKATPANTSGTDGDYEMLQGSAGRLWVDPSGVTLTVASHAVTNAGTFAVQAGVAAHGAAVSGNPVRIAGRAGTSNYTAVADGNTADLLTTILGKIVTMPYALPGSAWKYVGAAGGIVTTTAITIKTAGGAGVVNYITSITLVNSHQTIGTEVVINDGAAGTAIFRTWCQFAGGGVSIKCDPPLASSANTLLEIKEVTTTGTAGVVAQIIGYSAAE